jgi:hypothetical protein
LAAIELALLASFRRSAGLSTTKLRQNLPNYNGSVRRRQWNGIAASR